MPAKRARSSLVSAQPDQQYGKSKRGAEGSKGSASSLSSTPRSDDNTHRTTVKREDEFLRLSTPQQALLLLDVPAPNYSLERARYVPELRGDNEILVQVLAIGLSPVDWVGGDHGHSQPSMPWINGRDFAGIVVKEPRNPSRIRLGDVVLGPCSDHEDLRNAGYPEYVTNTDYNVARIPFGVYVKDAAALGVAFTAASIALGVGCGLDFSNLRQAPPGPDILHTVRDLHSDDVSDDVRKHIFTGTFAERPKPGEWLAIWGASSTTGQMVLQLSKMAGLKVICVSDLAKNGERLAEMGADMLVDKYDTPRAVEIIRAITKGTLRFAIDCVGKDTAEILEQALQRTGTGATSHLLGLAGLPKHNTNGIVHHELPIQIFHEVPRIGVQISQWLEELLIAKSLRFPEVEVAESGLADIDAALGPLYSGTLCGKLCGKRIVVAVGDRSNIAKPSLQSAGRVSLPDEPNDTLEYANDLNSDPGRVKFAYWTPNVSGGLVVSQMPLRTSWDLESNKRYAQIAERLGFEYALTQVRFRGRVSSEEQHEPVSFSQALLSATQKLNIAASILPGPWDPVLAAKQIASIDNYSNGRICVNIVSGWSKAEFSSIGQPWLTDTERYRRSCEFIECLQGIWKNERLTYSGEFYQVRDYCLQPKPLDLPSRPCPEIFQGSCSDVARERSITFCDYCFLKSDTVEGLRSRIANVQRQRTNSRRGSEMKFVLNAFVVCRETEEEAIRALQEVQGKSADSQIDNLIEEHDGLMSRLIGTKFQIAERICLLKSVGVDMILTAFLHYDEELEHFGTEVVPLVREMEKQTQRMNES